MALKRLGEILLEGKLINSEQLAEALKIQRERTGVSLGQVLVQQGYLTQKDLNLTLDYHNKRLKLGQILVKSKTVDKTRMEHALKVSQTKKIPLGKALLNLNYISEEQLAGSLSAQYDLPFMSLKAHHFSGDIKAIINKNFAVKHRVAVIDKSGRTVTLAMSFPLSPYAISELENVTDFKITAVIVKDSDISHAHEQIYGEKRQVKSDFGKIDLTLEDLTAEESRSKYVLDHNVEHLLKTLLSTAVGAGASDIHLENTENGMYVRFRIDGVLQHINMGADEHEIRTHGPSLISKIKIQCNLNITEKRRPQDGSFRVQVAKDKQKHSVDFRVSVIPSRYGENVVIRVLNKMGPMSLETLGFPTAEMHELTQLMDNPTGIFLVTGPTGSGKSSTLYAALGHLNNPGVKILTVEDPVEFSIDGISQSEVNEQIGNTFSELLRSFLRQDPDYIMVGEMRDLETSAIAIRAALTGHTVLSTLHTNDATSAITRLVDIGVEPALIATTVRCIISQRLIRVNCGYCRESYEPTEQLFENLPAEELVESLPEEEMFKSLPAKDLFKNLPAKEVTDDTPEVKEEEFNHMRGAGCIHCNYTGFSGRKPLIEMWAPNREETLAINKRPDNANLRELVFLTNSRKTMLENGLDLVRLGETTLEELIRNIPFEQISELQRKLRLKTKR